MPSSRAFANPFYVLVVVSGVAFLLTATSYGVMAFREIGGPAADSDSLLLTFLDRQGIVLMAVELGVLLLASVLAMATDGRWERRAAPQRQEVADAAHTTDDRA